MFFSVYFPQKNPLSIELIRGLVKEFGNDLLSHTVARAVPSAQESLTSVFGMGTGGTSPLWSPKNLNKYKVTSYQVDKVIK